MPKSAAPWRGPTPTGTGRPPTGLYCLVRQDSVPESRQPRASPSRTFTAQPATATAVAAVKMAVHRHRG
jgi:hypothetical protein